LVQRVIEEALRLPDFLDYSGIDRDPEGRLPEFNPKTYEDLLATAILNKVEILILVNFAADLVFYEIATIVRLWLEGL
jgi:hypothetical protein